VLVTHWQHALASKCQAEVQDLAECDLLLREHGSMTRQVTEAMLQEAGVTPRSTLVIGSREAIREATLHGLGCSVMPVGEAPAHPQLRMLPFVGGGPKLHEYLYCLKERRRARLIDAFLAEAVPAATGTAG
jgi:DNA-binding transcriptional LysR family regulator